MSLQLASTLAVCPQCGWCLILGQVFSRGQWWPLQLSSSSLPPVAYLTMLAFTRRGIDSSCTWPPSPYNILLLYLYPFSTYAACLALRLHDLLSAFTHLSTAF